jgi:hypothetical protein
MTVHRMCRRPENRRFRHFVSGFQPSDFGAVLTQPFGLGWDEAAPLALVRGWV